LIRPKKLDINPAIGGWFTKRKGITEKLKGLILRKQNQPFEDRPLSSAGFWINHRR
jgi:hypothetical protein